MQPLSPLQVIEDGSRAATLLHGTRTTLVRELRTPDSAAGLARRLGLPRQRVGYHLKELERNGFVELVDERKKRGCTERVVQSTAECFVLSPSVLGELGSDPHETRDRFSWAYLTTAAARVIRDLGVLRRRADRAKKKLPTLTLEAEVRFATQADQHAFTEELTQAIAALAAKHGAPQKGRIFRFFLGAYPKITRLAEDERKAT